MAIDIRADVTCSLGTIINGSISDSYIQGSGLVTTTGSVLINGIITPAVGQVVTFEYVKDGITRKIPKTLRVLSSFADPFRLTTQVELGCKLTYFADLKDPINWTYVNDPENADVPEGDAEIVTIPIYASSIAARCLYSLGLAPSGGTIPLTNQFSIAGFDFSAGYVSILSDLLVSECLFGFLDENEILQIRSLDINGGTGPVFTNSDIIDLGNIGTGELPGEAVVVSYSTLKLREPEPAAPEGSTAPGDPGPEPAGGGIGGTGPGEPGDPAGPEPAPPDPKLSWEASTTSSSPENFYVSYTDPITQASETATYSGAFSTTTETSYTTITYAEPPPDDIPLGGNFLGGILPSFNLIGSSATLTSEQQAELAAGNSGPLDEVWPDAENLDYVSDGLDQWVYLGSSWTLNPPTYAELFEENPTSVLSELFPAPDYNDYFAQNDSNWIHVGGGSWYERKNLLEANNENIVEKDVPAVRTTEESGPAISFCGSIASAYLSNGFAFSSGGGAISETIETYSYDQYGNQTGSTVIKSEPALKVAGSVSIKWADSSGFISPPSGFIITERIETSNITVGDTTQDVVSTYVHFAYSQGGQQAVAAAVEGAATLSDNANILDGVLAGGLVHEKTVVSTNRRGFATSQQRPSRQLLGLGSGAKGGPEPGPTGGASGGAGGGDDGSSLGGSGTSSEEVTDPNNGYQTSSTTSMALALGSAAAQRRIELSMPYAPDDHFVKYASGYYYAFPSDAEAKAMNFGRVQNRLLLGNRTGISIQITPEKMPDEPLSPLYIQAGGLTAMYRSNGNQWAFDSSGIVCSTDALFWGAVGGTGTFWFPTAPGTSVLPEEPEIINGEMNASNVLQAYNETVIATGRVRAGIVVRRFNYSLESLTIIGAVPINLGPEVGRCKIIEVPVSDIAIDKNAPVITISIDARVQDAPDALLEVFAPVVKKSVDVYVPSALDNLLTAPVPLVGSAIGNFVIPSSVDVNIATYVPFVGFSIVRVPETIETVVAPVPQVGGQIGSAALPPVSTVTVEAPLPTLV